MILELKDTIDRAETVVIILSKGGTEGQYTANLVVNSKALDLPSEHCPDLINTDRPSDNKPSCSLAEALEHQELFVNQFIATYGLQILWQIFRRGEVSNRGYFINLAGLSVPIQI